MTVIERLGSTLNLNGHWPVLALEGTDTFEPGKARFHRAPAPRPGEFEALLRTRITRLTRTWLRAGRRRGAALPRLRPRLALRAIDPRRHRVGHRRRSPGRAGREAPTSPLAGRPIQGRTGQALHRRSRWLLAQPRGGRRAKRARHARTGGPIHGPRPPRRAALKRPGRWPGGLEWKHPFSDGAPHGLFEPEDFIAPLAALVSRPRGYVLGRIR